MGEPTATYRQIITGPRWAGVSTFLKDEAFALGLEIKLDIDKGWISETIRCECRGEPDKIMRMASIVDTAIADYSKRIDAAKARTVR
jgi:hypothetical protein